MEAIVVKMVAAVETPTGYFAGRPRPRLGLSSRGISSGWLISAGTTSGSPGSSKSLKITASELLSQKVIHVLLLCISVGGIEV